MISRLVLTCILLTLLSPCVQAADIFVAPNGSDSNPGTKSQPFATLARARDEIRVRKAQHPARNYTVAGRGGKYRLNQTVVFDLRDSATAGHTITYEAYRDEKPVFTSAIPVTGWVREGKLWTAPTPSGLKTFRTLYDANGRLPRCRGPGFLPTQDYQTADKLDRFTLPYPPGAVKKWSNIDDIELMIRPNFGWMLDILPFESVDEVNHLARTSVPASYAMVKVRYAPARITTNGTAWIENAVDYLDTPGEWAVDSHQGKIYVLPRTGEKPEGIEAPTLPELIRVEGQINYDGAKDEPVRGLVFRGLSFTGGDRFSWERNRVGYTLQHDWEMFDRPTALVRLRGAEGIRIEKCRMVESGGAGLRMDLHCQSNRVSSCEFGHLGGAGILLAGYGPGTKDVNRHNIIERNHIHDIGELIWHASGIACFQSSENLVSHNLLHDLPYTAIVVSGRINWNREGKGDGWGTIRWKEIEALNRPELLPSPGHRPTWKEREPFLHGRNNLIEQNEIHDVMQKLWDGDGIYVSGTGGGNRVRENFIHDCLSENMCEGIRCDDDQEETIIERNVILRSGGIGTGIAIKGVNHILNNFVIDPIGAYRPRGIISLEFGPLPGTRIQRNILYSSDPALKPFFFKNLFAKPDPEIKETETDFNLYYHQTNSAWAAQHLAEAHAVGRELHSAVGDPLFRDAANRDYRFRSHSPAAKLGIEPIDLRKVGVR